MVRAWRQASNCSGPNPEPWIRVIARREALRIIANSKATVPLAAVVEETSDQDLHNAADRLDLMHAMTLLTAAERRALLLRYWGDRSDRQVAAILETPPGTVKIRIHRAHAKLAKQLD